MNKTTFKARVKSILKDNAEERFVSRMRSGTLDTKTYKNAKTTGKCFKKKLERKGRKYAVSILIDASGSMSGHKANVVSKAIPKIVQPLLDIGVQVELSAFNLAFHSYKMFDEKLDPNDMEKFMKSYRRLTNPAHPDIKLKDVGGKTLCEYVGEQKGQKYGYGYGYDFAAGYNCDGWAIHQAIERLKGQDGQKIFLILSDGWPAEKAYSYPHNDPKKAFTEYEIEYEVNKAKKEGVTILSVGICSDAVMEYYPRKNTRVIEDPDQIYDTVARLLSANIKRA